VIEVENLSKTYTLSRQQKKEMGPQFMVDTLDAVDGISFTCEPGRVYGLLGPNGAGKTTTLRIIATMLAPTEGIVTVDGLDVTEQPQAVCERIGFLIGSTGLYDRLTATELVRYYADLHGVPTADFEERRDHLFDPLDMHDFAAAQLSISFYAKSFKEAQSMVSPLLIAVIFPAFIGLLPGFSLNTTTALIPVLNVALATKDALAGTLGMGHLVLVYASLLTLAAASLGVCMFVIRSERVLFRT